MESPMSPTTDARPPLRAFDAEPPTPRWMRWTGWAISALVFLAMGPIAPLLVPPEEMRKGMAEMGYPPGAMWPILIAEAVAAVLYVIPRTAMLGAILLVGYLGGAVATHVRAGDGLWFVPVIFGLAVGLGLWLRDARVRAVVPWRWSSAGDVQ